MAKASEADIAGFVDKLAVFRESLSATEQELFDATLTAALSTAADEVQGFDTNPPVVQREWMGSILSNLANMRHESLKAVVNNLRA